MTSLAKLVLDKTSLYFFECKTCNWSKLCLKVWDSEAKSPPAGIRSGKNGERAREALNGLQKSCLDLFSLTVIASAH